MLDLTHLYPLLVFIRRINSVFIHQIIFYTCIYYLLFHFIRWVISNFKFWILNLLLNDKLFGKLVSMIGIYLSTTKLVFVAPNLCNFIIE